MALTPHLTIHGYVSAACVLYWLLHPRVFTISGYAVKAYYEFIIIIINTFNLALLSFSLLSLDALMIELSVICHHSLDIPSESQYMSLITKLIKRGEGHTSSSSHVITSDSIQSSSDMVGSVLISDIIKLRILPQDTLARGYNVFGPT